MIWYGTIQQFYIVSMWRKYLCPPNKRFFNVSFNINEFPRPHKKFTLCRLQYFFPIYYCKLINITNVQYLNNVICVYYDLMHFLLCERSLTKQCKKSYNFKNLFCHAVQRLDFKIGHQKNLMIISRKTIGLNQRKYF